VVQVRDVPRPEPKAGDVLVRVEAAAVTSGDARIRGARFPKGFAPFARLAFGVVRPRRPVLGGTFSGVVEAIGAEVAGLAVGDEVCGMSGTKMGTHAELLAVPAARAVRKPPEVTHEQAAGVLFGGTTALHFLRDRASLAPGATVLVNGASGAVGTNAVQLARHFGATVTGVTSAPNAALVESLGASQVVDHTAADLSSMDERFDVVMDTVGNVSIDAGRRLLAEGGVLLLVAADLWPMVRARGNVKAGPSKERRADFEELVQLVAAGHLRVVVDHVFDLEGIADAHRLVDTGHKVGNVIVRPNQTGERPPPAPSPSEVRP
jgi:NADPH:quinone reductase-like Zn-dependent oxidoreductase